jgi:cytoskeletal protein RodZ
MSLGALITKSRTAARLSIEDLSKMTNIPGSLLREMEDDNFKKCGGETYARGHLRNIAAKLEVDERVFLDLFEIEVAAPDKPIRELLSENNVTMPYQEPKHLSWKVLAAGSLAALILFGGAQIIFSNLNEDQDPVVIASTSASPEPQVETAAPIAADKVTVDIRATRGTTWLFASDENGTQIFSGQIRKGDSKRFIEEKQVNLRVGNAGGVDISVNGKSVGSIGADAEVVNLTYNAD